ncbi:hypothetical protein FOCC_FOCC016165 [Frankliniella occidentalis]|uniref:Acetyl-coenzyme A transporter 1 n=1 Tax=Frankliniella occidentalis TaxID=133901 RepID=A0A6J1S272_FRAOC|nr:acetyl-coenzyme A transporter 1 [Frankliniella occidentalis]KAE8738368.1 hypothetical protein FOCC_FOCC016165 [Frankliniella occidentalis]
MSRSTRRRQETSRTSTAANGDVEEQHNIMPSGPNAEIPSDIRGDRCNIAILFFLYLLQGIPMGLAAAIPMLMQSHGVSYKQQAEFSLVNWPFSLKLLWAPIVDSIYSNRFGRRKSWLIPAQFLIGFFMIFLGANVDSWLGDGAEEKAEPCVGFLTLMFFILNFLAATQDIAVDGWALTMLKRRNVAYASTCNSVGQSAGYFFGYVVFMALHSPDVSNKYLRSVPQPNGLVTISSFLNMWGWVFLTATVLVAILKREQVVHNPEHEPEPSLGFYRAYGLLWDISKLPSIRVLAFILLTAKIGFSACDAVTGLKLVDAGVPKEHLAFLAVLLVPLQIMLPIAICKYTTGSRPLDVYIAAVPYRLFFNVVAGAIVYFTPSFINDNGDVPLYYYIGLLLFYTCHQITLYMMFVAIMSFFVRISDPAVGGTYMTLLNTLANMGTTWPSTLSLYIVDSLTFRGCSSSLLSNNGCSLPNEVKACEAAGGHCTVQLDGYYVEMALCTVLGLMWLWWARPRIQGLQAKEVREWKVQRQRIR